MSDQTPSNAARIATGVAAGLIAGIAASFAMDRFQAWTQPSSGEDHEPATQQAADRVVQAATGFPLPKDDKKPGGQMVHYSLGAALGVAYGIAAEFVPQVTLGAGTAFAAATWSILDEGAVPAAGLGDPPWKASPASQAYSLASHAVFGFTAEMTRRLAHRVLAGVPTSGLA